MTFPMNWNATLIFNIGLCLRNLEQNIYNVYALGSILSDFTCFPNYLAFVGVWGISNK